MRVLPAAPVPPNYLLVCLVLCSSTSTNSDEAVSVSPPQCVLLQRACSVPWPPSAGRESWGSQVRETSIAQIGLEMTKLCWHALPAWPQWDYMCHEGISGQRQSHASVAWKVIRPPFCGQGESCSSLLFRLWAPGIPRQPQLQVSHPALPPNLPEHKTGNKQQHLDMFGRVLLRCCRR